MTVTGATALASTGQSTLGVFNTPANMVHLIAQGASTALGNVLFESGSELENQGTLTLIDGVDLVSEDSVAGNELVNDAAGIVSYTGSASTQEAFVQVFAPNAGKVSVGAGTLVYGGGSTSQADSGQFTAASGATLDLEGTGAENSGVTIAGAGIVDVTGGSTTTFKTGSQVTNTGTFQVDGAIVVPSATSVSAANLTLNNNLIGPGTLTVSGAATFGSGVTLGTFNTAGTGAHLITQGASTVTGEVVFEGGSELENQGTLTLIDGADLFDEDSVAGNELLNDSGGTVSYTGTASNASAAIGVLFTNNGTVSAGKGTLNLSNLTNLSSGGTLTGGTYNAVGGTLAMVNAVSTNGASITLGASPSAIQTGGSNALTGLTTNTGSLDLKQALTLVSTVSLANSGTVTVENGTFSTGTGYSQSAGSTTVATGATLKAGTNGASISAGSLSGNGTINGKLIGGGNITPQGATGGPMTVSSTFNNNSGTLTIPVSGTANAGTDFGQLSATSTATISGTLAIQTAAAFTPPDGTAYQVVKGSSVTGTFSSVTGATLPDRKYVLTYNANNVTATVHYFPTVSGVSPTSGPAAGSNTVTITGQHFQATSATGAATGVSFGGVAATSFTIVDDSHITATVPAGSAGTVDVTVTGPFGTSPTSSADQYTYLPAPSVSGVSPGSGPATGATNVTITGSHFSGATSVKFGSTAATNVQVVDDGHITATAPAGTGTVDVTVSTPGGTSATSSADQFAYVPVVSGVSPSSGPASGGTGVTITGSGFTGATGVAFGSTAATSVHVVDDGHITATSPAGSGTVHVAVTGPTGTSATSSSDQFTYQSSGGPAVKGLSPAAGSTKGNTVVHVTGSGFTGATAVTFGATSGTKLKVVDSGHITVTAPTHAIGSVDVRVTTPAGTSPINQPADVFTYYNPPTVASITSPADGPLAGGNTVQVKGTNFVVGQTSVKFGSTSGSNVQVSSATVLTVVAPATATAGSVDIQVTSPGGPSAKSVKDLYAYGAPTVSSFTPASGITGSTVTITGSGFAAGVTVSFGTLKSSTVKILSGTSLTATVPNGDTVASTITASDPQGSGASPTQFTATMGIKSFSPTSGSISAGTLVTITGVGFSADSVAAFNNVNAQTTFVDSQHVKAVVPAGSSTGFLTVTSPSTDNPSGTVTSKSKFTVNP